MKVVVRHLANPGTNPLVAAAADLRDCVGVE